MASIVGLWMRHFQQDGFIALDDQRSVSHDAPWLVVVLPLDVLAWSAPVG